MIVLLMSLFLAIPSTNDTYIERKVQNALLRDLEAYKLVQQEVVNVRRLMDRQEFDSSEEQALWFCLKLREHLGDRYQIAPRRTEYGVSFVNIKYGDRSWAVVPEKVVDSHPTMRDLSIRNGKNFKVLNAATFTKQEMLIKMEFELIRARQIRLSL